MQEKILIATDDPLLRERLSLLLGEHPDYHLVLSGTGDATVRLVSALHCQLVVLSSYGRRADGWAVCHALKHHPDTRDVKVLMLTADRTDSIHRLAFDVCADAVVELPCSAQELKRKVRHIVGVL